MYKYKQIPTTSITINKGYTGETIEQKINRIVNNKEPITDGAPLIFTERKEGIKPEHDIRTDRFEIAVEAMDKVAKTNIAKREQRLKSIGEEAKENMDKEQKTIGKPEPKQGTDPTGPSTK